MKIARPAELADFLRGDKDALVAAWAAEVKRLPRESELSQPVLLDHIPVLIDELVHDLELLAATGGTANVSRIHGEQRQTVGLSIRHIVEEYKLLRTCIIDHAESAGWIIAGESGRLLNKLIDEAIKTSIAAYVEHRDSEERNRREEYVSFIVHDLRSPLTAVYYAMLLLEKRLAKIRAEEQDLSIPAAVKRNLEHMQALIIKLLQAEQNIKMGSELEVERSTVHLQAAVRTAIEALSPSARRNETAVVNDVPDDLVVSADPELLQRAVQNLLSNAIDYAPKGTVTIGASADDGNVECWVTDDGEGIADEEISKVFDKFHTSRPGGGGMGLGLAVVKQIVEAHGGTVELESRLGQGTTVRLRLSREPQPSAEAQLGGG